MTKNPNIIPKSTHPELVFGLVAPIGTDVDLIINVLKDELSKVRYDSKTIKVTDLLSAVPHNFNIVHTPLDKKFESYIRAGNKLRELFESDDAFALLAVSEICRLRDEGIKNSNVIQEKTAYIIRQFKRPEEIEILRKVYGRGFIQISAYSSREDRLNKLTRAIAESNLREHRDEHYKGCAYDLMVRDEDEEDSTHGQRVKDAFPLADVVIDGATEATIRRTINRFVRAFFGDLFVTPTKDEYGMFASKAASLRSADLSRQVGAAITTVDGEIRVNGCNEVPKSHGGTYWEDGAVDYRDFQLGYDSSEAFKRQMLRDIFRRLKEDWLRPDLGEKDVDSLVDLAVKGDKKQKAILKGTNVLNLLEFGRIIHAEMNAITDAARLGISLKGTTLYSTTFPCHICARHIIAAGISRVVYLEPYAKSLAHDLYPEAIELDGQISTKKIRFDHFVGIAPERYQEIFRRGKRKDSDGNALRWKADSAVPILERIYPAYLQIEKVVITAVLSKLSQIEALDQ